MTKLEDTSVYVETNTDPLKKVNNELWWAFDAVCAYLVTYWTHSSDEMGIFGRLLVVAFILSFAYFIQSIYFTAGLKRPSSGEREADKWWHMAITHYCNIQFFWQWVYQIYYFFNNMHQSGDYMNEMITLTIGFGLCILLCDIIAGLVHWFGDSTDMHFFVLHHTNSRNMCFESYVHHCWDSLAFAFVLSFFVPPMNNTLLWSSIRLIACQGNECHMWSHCTSKEIPPFIKMLQDCTLVLSWKAHMNHHKPPHLVDYCVFNGWANPIMNIILPGPATNFLNNLTKTQTWGYLKEHLEL